MKNCRLFAFDLDGTMLQKGNRLTPAAENALQKAHEAGILTVPATGRLRDFLPPCLTALPFIRYAITSNGAAVYDLKTGELLSSCLIPCETACRVLEILSEYPIYMEFYADGRAVTKAGEPEIAMEKYGLPEEKRLFLQKNYLLVPDLVAYLKETSICPEKINLPYLTPEIRQGLLARLSQMEEISLTSSVPDNLEINAAQCSKGVGLAGLCRALNIAPEETAATGDNGNDMEMLKFAGFPIAMGNGTEEVKKIARAVAPSCEEDGAARAILDWIL